MLDNEQLVNLWCKLHEPFSEKLKIILGKWFDNENHMHTNYGKTGESVSTFASFTDYSYQSTLYRIF